MKPDGAVCYVEGKSGGLGVKEAEREAQRGTQRKKIFNKKIWIWSRRGARAGLEIPLASEEPFGQPLHEPWLAALGVPHRLLAAQPFSSEERTGISTLSRPLLQGRHGVLQGLAGERRLARLRLHAGQPRPVPRFREGPAHNGQLVLRERAFEPRHLPGQSGVLYSAPSAACSVRASAHASAARSCGRQSPSPEISGSISVSRISLFFYAPLRPCPGASVSRPTTPRRARARSRPLSQTLSAPRLSRCCALGHAEPETQKEKEKESAARRES